MSLSKKKVNLSAEGNIFGRGHPQETSSTKNANYLPHSVSIPNFSFVYFYLATQIVSESFIIFFFFSSFKCRTKSLLNARRKGNVQQIRCFLCIQDKAAFGHCGLVSLLFAQKDNDCSPTSWNSLDFVMFVKNWRKVFAHSFVHLQCILAWRNLRTCLRFCWERFVLLVCCFGWKIDIPCKHVWKHYSRWQAEENYPGSLLLNPGKITKFCQKLWEPYKWSIVEIKIQI